SFAQGDRRLHGDEAQDLQEVVLHHVLEGTHPVVVAGSPLQGQRLLPDDLDLLDVGAVPDRLQHPVGQAGPEQRLHRGHRQEVVDPEDLLLAQRGDQLPVEGRGTGKILPERLLEHDPTPGRQADREEGVDGEREGGRWMGEVDGHRVATGDAGGNGRRVAEVESLVAQPTDDEIPRPRPGGRSFRLQPGGGVRPEAIVVQVLPGGGDDLEAVPQVPGGPEGGQARKEVPPGEVAGGPQDDEALDHVARAPGNPAASAADAAPRVARSSASMTCITALINARWEKAWGKLPRWCPVWGSISSANNRSRLAAVSSLVHNERARSTSPISTRAETSQNEQMVKVPSSPSKPSSVSSTRYRRTSSSSVSSSATASTVARTRSSSGGRKPSSGMSSTEASSAVVS